jgi:hypothetical protein
MAEATTVWMVHALTGMEGVRGTLALEERTLVFRPAGGRSAETVIPAGEIRRVRRARGSPVMEVEISIAGAPPIIGFYFVKPPPLTPPTEGYRPFGRFLARRRAIASLRAGNAARRQDVEVWVDAVRAAQHEGLQED